jgi:D-alanyl-D-alanine carboxypeptidase
MHQIRGQARNSAMETRMTTCVTGQSRSSAGAHSTPRTSSRGARTLSAQQCLKRLCSYFIIAMLAAAFSLLPQRTAEAANEGPAFVLDLKSDLILYSEEADRLWHPASLTKLMTAYMTFEALKAGRITKDSKLHNSATARAQPPSKIGLPLNATLTVGKGLEILIVKSANDVAVMFAEKLGGSVDNFAKMMNQTARRLGMRKTRFFNPHGLPHNDQVTTARDMAILAKAIINDFPEHDHLFSMGSVKVGNRRMRSHNGLLRTYEGADGMKTGFICASGFNVVASATRNGRRIIAVVLGARTPKLRRQRAEKLFDHAFQNYWWKTLFPFTLAEASEKGAIHKGPANMRSKVCNYRPKKKYVKRKKKKKVAKKAKK